MTQTVEQAQAALAAAKANYLAELERDCERRDGSFAQEQRREEHQQRLREAVAQCELDLDAVKKP
jgi:multidrug resistance efflux pump